jgi:cobalt-zinc-cadmium efflux system membrane fusion protein
VISQVSGPVKDHGLARQQVKKGQPMLYVSSPDYSQLRATYLEGARHPFPAHKNYLRAQIYAHHATPNVMVAAESREMAGASRPAGGRAVAENSGHSPPGHVDRKLTSPEVPVLRPSRVKW